MFTGIVAKQVPITHLVPEGPGVKLSLDLGDWGTDLVLGESISVNGCCLTVVASEGPIAVFEAGEETLSKTTLGARKVGELVNVERAMLASDRLGGHLVTGHVDAVGELVDRKDDDEWSYLWFRLPSTLAPHLASKGSITVDGVSLTVVDVEADRFSVALIPHTLQVTTLGGLSVGDQVNLETDVLAKYVERQLASRLPNSG